MKKLALILAVILAASLLGCVQSGIALAASEIAFDNTYVLDDLNESKLASESFNIDNYGYNKERQANVLMFAEYGFNYDSDKQNYYSLYVYVYNPGGQSIGKERNKITVATVYENDKAVDYDSFELKLLSVSEGKYANLFYKFKVADVSKILMRVSVSTNVRRYDIGEIELNFGDANSEIFDVGNYYEYSGYAQGCGADADAESTLTCTSDSIDTLKLDVKTTYYRYHNYEPMTNLSSVYFGVPNEVLNKYGKLQQIKANWFETLTSTQFVLTDKTLYDHCIQYPGKKFSEMPSVYIGDRKVNYLYYDNTGMTTASSKLAWLFYDKQGDVSAERIAAFAKDYTDRVGGELLIDKYSKDLFVSKVEDGRQYGWQGDDGKGIVIDADSTFDINGFNVGDKFWTWFLSTISGLETETIEGVEPIKIVTDSDIVGSNKDVAERLLIAENDVDTFKQTYVNNTITGRKTVLLRFAKTHYQVDGLKANLVKNSFEIPLLVDKDVGYLVKQTVFLDFDVIWLKFVKEEQANVIPCISSPIDVVSELTPPETNNPLDWLKQAAEQFNAFIAWVTDNWWVIPVGIIAIGVVISLIVAIAKKSAAVVFKAIGKVLLFLLKWLAIILWQLVKWTALLPFTLLYYGIRALINRQTR